MARAIFSIVAGLIVAVAIVFAMNTLSHTIHPPPPGVDLTNPEALRALIADLPVTAFLVILLGWTLGAGFGAYIAVYVAKRAVRWTGYLVGTLVLIASLYNLFTIPHPVWFFVAAVVGVPLATWLGTHFGYAGGVGTSPMTPAPAA